MYLFFLRWLLLRGIVDGAHIEDGHVPTSNCNNVNADGMLDGNFANAWIAANRRLPYVVVLPPFQHYEYACPSF